MKEKGFTLIELIVVVFIIGILATLIMVNVSSSKLKARDSIRKSDLRQVQTSLNLYIDSNGGLYPANVEAASGKGATNYTALSTYLTPVYLPKFPNDPTNSPTGDYQFRYKTDATRKGFELSAALERCRPTTCSDTSPQNDGGNDSYRFEVGTLKYKVGASYVDYDTAGSL